jgi:thiol-disulfide isomerase/thioredoxin
MVFQTRSVFSKLPCKTPLVILLLIVFYSYQPRAHAQNEPLLQDLQAVTNLIHASESPLTIINLWATWCAPCLEEIPYFEQLRDKYDMKNVRIILLSLDRPKDVETRVKPCMDQLRIENEVWVLTEKDPNLFIPAIESRWSGAIPATLFIQPSAGFYRFYEKPLTFTELDSIVAPLIKP